MEYIENLVTVVVPVFNVEKYLDDCVKSILNQTYRKIEVLLVDDGSQDNSPAICDRYQENDSRVTVFHKKNGGLTSARQFGFHKAHGEYIVFFDSDDIICSTYVEDQLSNLKNTNADLSICRYYVRNDHSDREWMIKHSSDQYYKDSFLSELILPSIWNFESDKSNVPNFLWLRMMKTKLVSDKCFFSEREVYTEDIFFNIEYLKNCLCISFLDRPLYYYCIHTDTLTHKHRDKRVQMEIRRIHFLREALQFYGFTDETRLILSAFRGVCGCINNAWHLGNYNSFKNEVKEVLKHPEVNSILLNTPTQYLSKSEWIRYIGCRLKLYRVLYCFEYKMNK